MKRLRSLFLLVLIGVSLVYSTAGDVTAAPALQQEGPPRASGGTLPWFFESLSTAEGQRCGQNFASDLAAAARELDGSNPEGALRIYETVLRKDRRCLDAYRGIALADTDPFQGIARLQQYLDEGVELPELYLVMGEQYLSLKMWIEAFKAFDMVRQLNGATGGRCASAGLGIALFEMGATYPADVAFIHSALEPEEYRYREEYEFQQEYWSCPAIREQAYAIYQTPYTPAELQSFTLSNDPPYLRAHLTEGLTDAMIQSRMYSYEIDHAMDLRYAVRSGYRRAAQLAFSQGSLGAGLLYLEKARKMAQEMNAIWESRLEKFGTSVMGLRQQYPNLGYFLVVEDFVAEADLLVQTGRVYLDLDYRQVAGQYFTQAEQMSQKAYNVAAQWNDNFSALVLPTLKYSGGLVEFAAGRKEQAQQAFQEVLASDTFLGPFQLTQYSLERVVGTLNSRPPGWARAGTLMELGMLYVQEQDWDRAETYLLEARAENLHYTPVFTYTGDIRAPVSPLLLFNLLGFIATQKGQPWAAANTYRLVLEKTEGGENLDERADALGGLANVYARSGDTDLALAYALEALRLREELAGRLGVDAFKSSYHADTASLYDLTVGLLVQRQRYRAAFELSERGRARAFLDSLNAGRSPAAPAGADTRLLLRRQALQSQLVLAQEKLSAERSQPAGEQDVLQIESLQSQLQATEMEYEGLLAEMAVAGFQPGSLGNIAPTGLDALQAALGPDTTLVSYQLSGEQAGAFVISRDAFSYHRLPVSVEQIRRSVQAFRTTGFARLDPAGGVPPQLQQLYQWLVAPLQKDLKTPILGIVPHGVLHYVPFAALFDGQLYLVDCYQLFYLPSASTYPYVMQKRSTPPTSLTAFGYNAPPGLPALAFAEKEAAEAIQIFGGQAFLGDSATEANFHRQAPGSEALLISAHAELDTANPDFSSIRLAGQGQTFATNGVLDLLEVYDLDLRQTRLVVLSGCDTGQGALTQGDDLVSLNRAFLNAGAGNVIATLWKVDDQSSALLVRRLFEHLRAGHSPADALRRAQVETREQYPHPYYWAAFALTGDGGGQPGGDAAQGAGATQTGREEMNVAAGRGWPGPGSVLALVIGLAGCLAAVYRGRRLYRESRALRWEVERAAEQIRAGRTEDGEYVLRSALRRNALLADAWYWLAIAAQQGGRQRLAQRCFGIATRLGKSWTTNDEEGAHA